MNTIENPSTIALLTFKYGPILEMQGIYIVHFYLILAFLIFNFEVNFCFILIIKYYVKFLPCYCQKNRIQNATAIETFFRFTWQVAVAEHISLLNQQAFYSNQKRLELYIRLQRTSSRTKNYKKHKITGIQPLSHIRFHILKQENILKNYD